MLMRLIGKQKGNTKMSKETFEEILAEKDAEIMKWKVSAIKSDRDWRDEHQRNSDYIGELRNLRIEKVEDIKTIETLTAKLQTKDALIKELTKANAPSRVMELLVKPLENENKALRDLLNMAVRIEN